ncbi:uncharacterized protein A1O9_07929 [Exophiala aquamarina CBS 119918]|uniref:RlpA-like protein double-psi beta-barrel domain-containing protein n=1 Tax=Exophiala aquamarina CBS 119918 TaxID=1182545 RepID=A0A072PAR4_9EURO|nr:uncharacterized protein A1O9_07929 [Exophiala aquamarina CBS 119918]KEF56348.1 hypothetical protein A1O9_07929 [Exophiala aquamarina CBS 119918]
MAVLKNIVLAASLLAPAVVAIPMMDMDKRAIYTHTETAIAWVTVEETTTVWVEPAAATPPPPPAATTTSTVPAAIFAQTSYIPSTFTTQPAPVPTTPSVPDVPAVAPAPAASAPVVSSAAPAASSSVPVQPKDTAGSTTGTCEGSGATCVGDVTHWDGGLGACGWNVDTNSQMAIALPHAFMGTQSNGNPYCGRSVTLVNPTSGTTVQATVGDKCMGCEGRSIDCTDALFNAITDGKGDGRLSGIQWYFS